MFPPRPQRLNYHDVSSVSFIRSSLRNNLYPQPQSNERLPF
ncbi:hypothetical protein HOLDEFILI_01127 [Holdemania filiformis DSM 12042]|uniref:Uncharacterized protein n=1 Tax=Holdemania filiformis DSM 12042 TaxID=545696 RepID=B9Y5P4_9FIRM|nr:hypothetical protein HOLDEFILI_01127 [Holdemania filiformis DSM 12042]